MSDPGIPSSARIKSLNAIPSIPDHEPRIKYKVPISLWFVENNHLFGKMADNRQ